ncbi:hypothetical protein [Desulfosarcina ovata]|uniref:Uncharacterized protein n=1 Tax=Desulfosarcina ovata subsp. ovata TaxID=2752305 RepID=A0A5K8ABD8_9BACT|nr:hypothetical protein [Desulfosarcina ovata]BBO89925.1 hypothetical protein DSCOOX_31050 [Desulfosarcina ovata subsp. ovata]
MGKGSRLKRQRKEKQLTDSEIYNLFSGEGLEELTNELYEELLANGWKEKDLKFFQQRGSRYCRSRNSFLDEPQFMGDE